MDGVMHMRMARWACRKVEDKYPVWGAHIEDAAISSTYPDAYIFGEDAKDKSGWDPLWRELDQIPTEQGPRPAQTIFDTLRLRETYPIVFRYLIHLSVESLRASRDELGVKAAGTLSHLIGDTVQAAHTTDNRMVTAMYPMGSWRYMTHAFMEAVFAELPDSVPYAPRLLADSEEMLCWRLCEELEKDKRLSIGEIPNLMGALRRGDQRAAEESAYRSAMTGAQLLADVMLTLSRLADGTAKDVGAIDLAGLEPLACDVDNMFNYEPMIDLIPGERFDSPTALDIGEGDTHGLCLLPMMAPSYQGRREAWVAYTLPGCGLTAFEARLGIQRFHAPERIPFHARGNETSVFFEIRLDDQCVWRSEAIDETTPPTPVHVPLGSAKKLTIYVCDTRVCDPLTKFVYPVVEKPRLI